MNLSFAETSTQAFQTTPVWAWLILCAAFLFAIAAGAWALFAAKRARWIESLVATRTAELAQINEKLAEEICDHLNTEHALDKERESLKAVLNNLHEGILVLDANGQLRIANGAALKIYSHVVGEELERFDRMTPFDFYGSAEQRKTRGSNWPHLRALAGETVRDFELIVDPPKGRSATLSINAQPLFTSDGRQHGAVIVIRDITDSRKVERLKAEFVATVSHELRTPITSIRGSLGLIASGTSGPLSEKTKNMVDIAVRNADRLNHLINDLLDIEKMESGHMRFELQRQSLNQLIELAIEANQGYAESFGVRLDYRRPTEDATVDVDPYRLLQVLANLLSNAVKFSPQGSTVDIVLSASGHSVKTAIRDRGAGIPEEFQPRMFQKFSQADSSDARNCNGTGLGLAICKAIIEQMSGTIGFDSEAGKGTTFYFELPLVEENAMSDQ